MANPVPMPVQDPIARKRRQDLPKGATDPYEGCMPDTWVKYFQNQSDAITDTAQRLNVTELTAQSASLGATPIAVGALAAGFYRITYYARITQAATTSSSLTVTIGWTDSGLSCSASGAPMTGNTTGTLQSGSQTFKIDQATPITYATTYASVGATSMQYKLAVILEVMS